MDDEMTTGGPPAGDPPAANEIQASVEASLKAANGSVAPLTGLDGDEHQQDEPGEVVSQAQAKLDDVKSQAQAKAADVKSQAQAKLGEVKSQAQAKADEVKSQAQAKADEVKSQAQEKLEGVKAQAQSKVDEVKNQAQEKLTAAQETLSSKSDDVLVKAKAVSPESVAQRAWTLARENPWPVAVGGAFLLGRVLGRTPSPRRGTAAPINSNPPDQATEGG